MILYFHNVPPRTNIQLLPFRAVEVRIKQPNCNINPPEKKLYVDKKLNPDIDLKIKGNNCFIKQEGHDGRSPEYH